MEGHEYFIRAVLRNPNLEFAYNFAQNISENTVRPFVNAVHSQSLKNYNIL